MRQEKSYRRSGSGYSKAPARRGQPGTLDWIGDAVKIILVILVIMFCISMSHRAYEIGYNIFYEKAIDDSANARTVEVTITADMSVSQIGKLLKEEGLIEDAEVFQYQERFSSYHGKIKPGTYQLSTGMTPSEMIKEMAEDSEDETN